MHTNVGTVDRVLRVVLGLALIAMVFLGPKSAWGWVGLILVATALVGWCPLYSLLGVRTCKVNSKLGART